MNIKKQIIALTTITKKEIIRILRIWPQTLIPPVITTSLYFIIFGEILFKNKAITVSGQTVEYLHYLIPGLIVMAIINNSYTNTVSSFFISKFHRNIEEVMFAPVPVPIIILGFALGGIARGLMTALMIFVTAILFGATSIYSLSMLLATAFLTALFFSLAGIINAIFAKNFDETTWFPAFILTPMTYLGGVFFSIDMLPNNWQVIAKLNPVYHFINIFRYSFIGVGEFSFMYLTAIICANIIVFLLATLAFQKKMKK